MQFVPLAAHTTLAAGPMLVVAPLIPAPGVWRRLKRKTSVIVQEAIDPIDLEAEVGSKAHRQVYLVTLPHPKQGVSSDGFRLVPPDTLTKSVVLDSFLACCRAPMHTDGRHRASGGPGIDILKTGVWREFHKQGPGGDLPRAHDHLAVLAAKQFRYMPVKRALLQRFGLASHWSCTHTGYWSAVRYLAMPSPKKPSRALDGNPVLWAASGVHPPPSECCHEPLTAQALRKRRLAAEAEAAENGVREPKVTEMDVWPIVVKEGFCNKPDAEHAHLELTAFAKNNCSPAMQRFLFKHRQSLLGLLDDIWRWENVEERLGKARMTRLRALQKASEQPCSCQGRWLKIVLEVFKNNSIKVEDVCHDVYQSLEAGRSERTPVIVFAGAEGGEGKSFFLKALFNCYGHDYVFSAPQKGNFPLLDLPGKKVAVLDDWRFDGTVVPFATQCLWFDGSALPIAQPQNQPSKLGHVLYRGSAPIFATTKSDDMKRLQTAADLDPRTGTPRDANASMVLRRLKLYFFTTKLAKPDCTIPFCAHCFANLVLLHKA